MKALKKKTILFICTGNICRSPMAQALLERELKAHGLSDAYAASSAGVRTEFSGTMTPTAEKALKALGIDDFIHVAKQVTKRMLNDAWLVLCMSDWHVKEVKRLAPDCNACTIKAYALKKGAEPDATGEGEILDPYGSGYTIYYETAVELESLIKDIVKGLKGSDDPS